MKTLKVTFERQIKNLSEIQRLLNEIAFWNVNGQFIYDDNQKGTMGSKETQTLSNMVDCEEFALITILGELKSLIPSFKIGKGSNHIWISEDGENRNILISF